MAVSILSYGVGKTFSVRPPADDDLICRNVWKGVFIFSDGVGKPFSVRPAAIDDLICRKT